MASGNLSEDDPVKMRAKKLKSDDGDDEGEEDVEGDGERNAGVKYAASIIIVSAPSTPKVESQEEGPTRRERTDEEEGEKR